MPAEQGTAIVTIGSGGTVADWRRHPCPQEQSLLGSASCSQAVMWPLWFFSKVEICICVRNFMIFKVLATNPAIKKTHRKSQTKHICGLDAVHGPPLGDLCVGLGSLDSPLLKEFITSFARTEQRVGRDGGPCLRSCVKTEKRWAVGEATARPSLFWARWPPARKPWMCYLPGSWTWKTKSDPPSGCC